MLLKEFNSFRRVNDVGIALKDIVCKGYRRRNMDAATGREGDGVIRAVATQRAQGAVAATTILEFSQTTSKTRSTNGWMALRRFDFDIMVGV